MIPDSKSTPFRLAANQEPTNWNKLVLANPDQGHSLQSFEWGEFKRHWNQESVQFVLENNNQPVLAFQVLKRKTPLGLMWYCPKGPGLTTFTDPLWPELLTLLKTEAAKDKAVLVKIEPEVIETPQEITQYKKLGLYKAALDVQLKATIFIDLKKSETELLANFKPKTRYNIRLGEKSGVVVKEGSSQQAMETLYQLIAKTRERAGVLMRPKKYFFDYWEQALRAASFQQSAYQPPALKGKIFIAFFQDKPLAGVFIHCFGNKIWYKDGGSTQEHKELMAPYLLQWQVMKWAHEHGFEKYDLVGVPPKKLLGEKHSMWGLYRFKSGFNDQITEFVGCLDLPIKPLRYRIWKVSEIFYTTLIATYKKIKRFN